MCQSHGPGNADPRKAGHVSEEVEVYVPKGSAHGETILFRGKVSDQLNSVQLDVFKGNSYGWMVKPCFP